MHLALVYSLPSRLFNGRGAGFLNQALGGWTASSFYLFATGFPLGVTHTYGRPIRLRNASLDTPQSQRLGTHRDAAGNILNPFFDTKAFQPLPSQYMVSPEPPRFPELVGPGQNRVTLSVFKAFPIRERLKLEARMEAMDATNSPQYDPPATNMSNAATFGAITTSRGARKMMGALRLIF